MDTFIKRKILEKYKTKDQLVQQGIWKGEIYNTNNWSIDDSNIRGWLWRAIVLNIDDNDHDDQLDFNDALSCNSTSSPNSNDTFLFNIPELSLNNTLNNNRLNSNQFSDDEITAISIASEEKIIPSNTNLPTKKNISRTRSLIRKKNTQNVRRLTPKETPSFNINNTDINSNTNDHTNDYHSSPTKSDNTNYDDDEIEMSISETIEIIDLDLNRLLLHPIFRHPIIHNQMRLLLYNFILLIRNDPLVINPFSRNYQQGFHELLGMVYLQIYLTNHGNNNNITLDPLPDNNNTNNISGLSNMEMKNVFNIFIELMQQVKPIFYERSSLVAWETEQFSEILRNCNLQIFNKFFPYIKLQHNSNNNKFKYTNLVWLVRWTRLLFLRELPKDQYLIIWDHIMTFTYPLSTFIACIITILLLCIYNDLIDIEPDDNDEILELMLHYKFNSKLINATELCKMAGNLCELFYYEKYDDMKLICDNFLKLKFNIHSNINGNSNVDPNRIRIEERLRLRVKRARDRPI